MARHDGAGTAGDVRPLPRRVQPLRAAPRTRHRRSPGGLCFGGGFELALRADVVFAGQSARFGHPEQTLGITTLLGGIYRVAERVGRARAFEWALTSEHVPAQVMADTSVINRLVPDDELLSHAGDFARRVACGPTLAHAAHKALLHSWPLGGPGSLRPVRTAVRDTGRPRRPGVRRRGAAGGQAPAGPGLPRPLTAAPRSVRDVSTTANFFHPPRHRAALRRPAGAYECREGTR
ncbi:enoyl-CoA hydratase/isomerase family protein [Streptomyces sp. NPDC086519]|uniref:enoyl-CoA hydratase/isomerase family protein n=1 Tax=Streptomyces sp. NPDC086519 TaxID=3154863 RepID=UPI0034294EBE